MNRILIGCLILVFIFGLFSITLPVSAQKEGYSVNDHIITELPTIDGKWTSSLEWSDAEEKQLDGDLNVIFRLKFNPETTSEDIYQQFFLIEFLDDTTINPEDYIQICYAAEADLGVDGGLFPTVDCFRWDWVGHDVSGFNFYQGDGSIWGENNAYSWGVPILIADSIDTSPLSDTPHLIVEVRISHRSYRLDPEFWIRVAAYDETNADSGVQSWPEGSRDVPNDWGQLIIIQETIPEYPGWSILPILISTTLIAISIIKKLQTQPD